MALPFIAGIALGAGIAFAFSKRGEIAKSLGNLNLDKKLQDGLNVSKSAVMSVKDKVQTKPTRKKPGRKPRAKIQTKETTNSNMTNLEQTQNEPNVQNNILRDDQ